MIMIVLLIRSFTYITVEEAYDREEIVDLSAGVKDKVQKTRRLVH